MTHPLTDDIIEDLRYRSDDMDDDMRTAADWQLKQCEDEVSRILALMVLSKKINREESIGLLETFKSHMRPTTTEEDS